MPTLEALKRLESQINALENAPLSSSDMFTPSGDGVTEANDLLQAPPQDWVHEENTAPAAPGKQMSVLPEINEEPLTESIHIPESPDIHEESELENTQISESPENLPSSLENFEPDEFEQAADSVRMPQAESSDEEIRIERDIDLIEEMTGDGIEDNLESSNVFRFDGDEKGFIEDFDIGSESSDDITVQADSDFSLEESEYQTIRQTLSELPRNLKIAIEILLADDTLRTDDLEHLVDPLIKGKSPRHIAQVFYNITNQKIEIPRDYARRSGRLFEEQKQSLSYHLKYEMWPILRNLFIVISLLWIVSAAVFTGVYRPLKARSLYQKGLEAIAVDQLEEASRYFHDAWDGWPLFAPREEGRRIADAPVVIKGWKVPRRWLDYSRAFRRRKHWKETREFYEGYLSVKSGDKNARLEFVYFLVSVLGEYEAAIRILEDARSSSSRWDEELTLAVGDIYLEWAEDDPSKYEEARYRYVEVLDRVGSDEHAILSMMRYHLRLGNEQEILNLLPVFQTNFTVSKKHGALAAEVYAALAEFFLARDNFNSAHQFVEMAQNADSHSPEAFFANALYWRSLDNEQEALKAFQRTLVNLEGREILNRRLLKMKILTLGGIGRIYASISSNINEDAEVISDLRSLAIQNYIKALELYEDSRSRQQLGRSPEYGILYIGLADILYAETRLENSAAFTLNALQTRNDLSGEQLRALGQAERYYRQAESILDRGDGESDLPDEQLYRHAYAQYILEQDEALLDFYRVFRRRPDDYQASMALSLILLENGDYDASRTYYTRSIALLDDEVQRSGGALEPDISESHREILLRYAAAWNNLGVGRALSSSRNNLEGGYKDALAAFTTASSYLDNLSTDMDTLAASGIAGFRDPENRRVVKLIGDRRILAEEESIPYRNRLRILGLEEASPDEEPYLIYAGIPSDLNPR